MLPVIQITAAVFLSLLVIFREQRQKPLKHPQLFVVGSFACCAWGIIAQLTTIRARFFAGDFAGLEDTIDAVILISVIMTIVTLILNLIALGVSDRSEE